MESLLFQIWSCKMSDLYLQGIELFLNNFSLYLMISMFQNGTTSCETVPCPPVRACTPDDSVEEITACCPKCNRSKSHMLYY